MRLILMTLFLIFQSSLVLSQEHRIEGKILSDGKGLAFASIAVKTENGQTVAFTQADENGLFKIPITQAQLDAIKTIEVRRLGYESVIHTKVDGQTFYEVTLQEKPQQLEEVLVKRKMIDQRGDTLIYDVASFLQAGDHSIGDVIKRMPGMVVQSSGKILYNGQEISHLYIDGDDLLQGRYALGTRAIPQRMVGRVEVLRNHEPINILKDVSFSDKVAVNLSLKSDTKLHVSSEFNLGGGMPEVFDGTWNGMVFNKKIKTLNAIRSNNSGTDLRRDFQDFSLASSPFYSDAFQNFNFLNSVTVSEPFINYNRYYDNLSGSAQINYLENLGKDWQLRTAATYWRDRNHFNYSRNLQFLTEDKQLYQEAQQMTQNAEIAFLNLNWRKNSDKLYLNNRLQFNYEMKKNESQLNFNSDAWENQLNAKHFMFSTETRAILMINDAKRLDIEHGGMFEKAPQNFIILPRSSLGEMENPNFDQRFENPTWNNRLSLKYMFSKKPKFQQNYSLVLLNQSMHLQSDLHSSETSDRNLDPLLLTNNLKWKQNKAIINTDWEFFTNKIRTKVFLPLHFQSLNYQDAHYSLDYRSQKIYLEPSLTSYTPLFNNELIVQYGYNRRFGGIDGAFKGIILRNFGFMESNQNSVIPSSENYSGSINYKIQKPEKFLFGNLRFSHSLSYITMLKSQIFHDDYIENISLYAPHRNQMWTITGEVSKYMGVLKTNLRITPEYSHIISNALLNEQSYEASMNRYNIGYEVDFPTLKQVRILWNGAQKWSRSENNSNNLFKSENNFSLTYTLTKSVLLKGVYNQMYYKNARNNPLNYQFVDFSARYTLAKGKVNFELSMLNLGNVQQFSQVFEDTFQISESFYNLRGRMIMGYINFTL